MKETNSLEKLYCRIKIFEAILTHKYCLPSMHCLATGMVYFAGIPRVDSTCIPVDNTVRSTGNTVPYKIKTSSIKYSKDVNLKVR